MTLQKDLKHMKSCNIHGHFFILIFYILNNYRYKKDLPPDALKMNDVYVRAYTSSGIQSNNDIRTIMAAAKTIPNQSDPIELPDIEVERIITNEIETHSPIKD